MGLQVMWTPTEVAEATATGTGVQARLFILGTGQRGGPYQHPSKSLQSHLRENSIWLIIQNANVQVPVTSCYFITAHSIWRSLPFLLASHPSPTREAVRRQGWGEGAQRVSTVCSLSTPEIQATNHCSSFYHHQQQPRLFPLPQPCHHQHYQQQAARSKGLTCLGKDMTTDLGQGCV